MATSFDEILLNPDYSAIASGGPEWATAIVRSGEGGAIAHRNVNREDYVSRYEIDFSDLTQARKKDLRSFGILRQGMARAFRFLAPDDSLLEFEPVGILNPSTGEVGYLTATAGETLFYCIRHYSDEFNAYNRRICKISSYASFKVEVFATGDLNTVLGTAIFAADPFHNVHVQSVVASKTGTIVVSGVPKSITLDYRHGTISITPALANNRTLRVTGEYHLPVAFTDDWQKFSIDEAYQGSRKVNLEEVLPVELGII